MSPLRWVGWLGGHLYGAPILPRRITCLALFLLWHTLASWRMLRIWPATATPPGITGPGCPRPLGPSVLPIVIVSLGLLLAAVVLLAMLLRWER